MATYEWTPRKRHYEREGKAVPREVTTSHPLKALTVTVTDTKLKKLGGKGSRSSSVSSNASDKPAHPLDPLSAALEGTDPLSQMAAEASMDPLSKAMGAASLSSRMSHSESSDSLKSSRLDDSFEPWSSKKAGILSKFTTSEKLSITTSFLLSADKEKMTVKSQSSTVTDKVKNRLEQLDDFEEGSVQEMLNLSQQDYVNRIEELNQALIQAWDEDQRVKALKIAIQCAKLLADTSVIQFYPSKFVLITDILDTFGRLVYERIRNKSQYYPKGSNIPVQLPEDFTPDQVPDSAKETCRNWFFKIASIRELVPRLYVEAALLHCYSFLTTGEYSQALMRLARMIRGIGDPLVSVYARCYLCRVGILVAPSQREHLMPCFDDFLFSYKQLQGDSVQNILAIQKLEMPRYLTLYSPALDWLMQCIAHQASEQTLLQVLEKCKETVNSALLLNSIMSAFKPEYIAVRSAEFTSMIKECEETGFPKHLLYRSLGMCLVLADPPEEQRLLLLNEVWKAVMKFKTASDYISCAEIWIEYVVKNFTKREVNTILADIIKHMTPDRAFEDFYPQLQSIVSKILSHMHDFSTLFSLEKFLPFIDMFQRDAVKVEVCKNIMEAFIKNQQEPTNDPVIINALMFICKTMHDSVNALTLDDEIRQIGHLIIGLIRNISFGRDFEQQLSFYVESRANFSNIDAVLIHLIQSVNRLAMETWKIVKGGHSRKTAAFVRACVAYTFISIPSLNSVFHRLNLYLHSGRVAMLNQCFSQGDAFFKAAISLVTEIPRVMEIDGKMRSTEPLLTDFISNFVSTLLVVPDNPEQGVLYLLRGLLNVLQDYTWDGNTDGKALAYMNVLSMLSASSQETFIYHIHAVDSNDVLYGHDPKYLNEIISICQTLVNEILHHLKSQEKTETRKRQASLALELFNRLVAHADLGAEPVSTLAVNLWGLATKHTQLDTKLMIRSLNYVKQKGTRPDGEAYSALQARLPLQSRA